MRITFHVVGQLEERLGANAVPVQINIGTEDEFAGVVDLLLYESHYVERRRQGMTYDLEDVLQTWLTLLKSGVKKCSRPPRKQMKN